VIDIHCHILPEVDDGPRSWDIAEQMCRMAAQDGTAHIVATPHANDHYHYDRNYLSRLLRDLQRRIGNTVELSLGCDFHLSFENMQNALQAPQQYCIGDSRYLLIEFSNFSIPQQIDDWIDQMLERGTVPIITHPERNPLLQQNQDRVLQWVNLGCGVQVTASALTGSWGTRAQQAAQWLFKRKAVHILASDGHDAVRRPPVLSEASRTVANEFGADTAQALLERNPAAVIRNGAPPWTNAGFNE
jgi:protein-tyrosine phosphatase